MDKFKQRCYRIIDELINEGFPELNGKIKLKINFLKIGSMWASKKRGYFLVIIDKPKYEFLSDSEIRGALAHEFVHFINYSGIFGWLRYWLENLAFYFSKYFMEKFEKAADKKTIEGGFAKDLYNCRKARLKNISKDYKKTYASLYLTPEEIKNYAKQVGKW